MVCSKRKLIPSVTSCRLRKFLLSEIAAGWSASTGQGANCSFFSKKIAAALLKDGKAKVKGLYSERTGKTYDGTVLLCDTGEKYVNYRIEQRK